MSVTPSPTHPHQHTQTLHSLVGVLHYLHQQQVAVAADELLGKGHVGGDAGQLLQRVAADARVGALDAPVQVLSAAALPSRHRSFID